MFIFIYNKSHTHIYNNAHAYTHTRLWAELCHFKIYIARVSVAQLVGTLSHKPKVCRFSSHSGHKPRLQVRSQLWCT